MEQFRNQSESAGRQDHSPFETSSDKSTEKKKDKEKDKKSKESRVERIQAAIQRALDSLLSPRKEDTPTKLMDSKPSRSEAEASSESLATEQTKDELSRYQEAAADAAGARVRRQDLAVSEVQRYSSERSSLSGGEDLAGQQARIDSRSQADSAWQRARQRLRSYLDARSLAKEADSQPQPIVSQESLDTQQRSGVERQPDNGELIDDDAALNESDDNGAWQRARQRLRSYLDARNSDKLPKPESGSEVSSDRPEAMHHYRSDSGATEPAPARVDVESSSRQSDAINATISYATFNEYRRRREQRKIENKLERQKRQYQRQVEQAEQRLQSQIEQLSRKSDKLKSGTRKQVASGQYTSSSRSVTQAEAKPDQQSIQPPHNDERRLDYPPQPAAERTLPPSQPASAETGYAGPPAPVSKAETSTQPVAKDRIERAVEPRRTVEPEQQAVAISEQARSQTEPQPLKEIIRQQQAAIAESRLEARQSYESAQPVDRLPAQQSPASTSNQQTVGRRMPPVASPSPVAGSSSNPQTVSRSSKNQQQSLPKKTFADSQLAWLLLVVINVVLIALLVRELVG